MKNKINFIFYIPTKTKPNKVTKHTAMCNWQNSLQSVTVYDTPMVTCDCVYNCVVCLFVSAFLWMWNTVIDYHFEWNKFNQQNDMCFIDCCELGPPIYLCLKKKRSELELFPNFWMFSILHWWQCLCIIIIMMWIVVV